MQTYTRTSSTVERPYRASAAPYSGPSRETPSEAERVEMAVAQTGHGTARAFLFTALVIGLLVSAVLLNLAWLALQLPL